MRKFTVLGTILTAPMIALAGVALAADPEPSVGSGASGAEVEAGEMTKDVQTPAMPGDTAAQADMPAETVIGREVFNIEGDSVGSVSAVTDDRVIVEVGGFLGIGTREVALNWSDLTLIGSGETMTLQTNFTKEQIKELPEYAE